MRRQTESAFAKRDGRKKQVCLSRHNFSTRNCLLNWNSGLSKLRKIQGAQGAAGRDEGEIQKMSGRLKVSLVGAVVIWIVARSVYAFEPIRQEVPHASSPGATAACSVYAPAHAPAPASFRAGR